MDGSAPISETRHRVLLDELASLGMSLARELHRQAMAAKGADEAVRLANGFHKLARGVRQTVALEARLGREQEAHELAVAVPREKDLQTRIARRRTELQREVERLIWDEHEGDEEGEELYLDLTELIEQEALDAGFPDEPIEAQIARLCETLGLACAHAGAPPDAGVAPPDSS